MPHEPKKKRAKANKRTRRASIMLTSVKLIVCKNCNEKTIAHMSCRSCGFYGGESVKGVSQKAVVTRA